MKMKKILLVCAAAVLLCTSGIAGCGKRVKELPDDGVLTIFRWDFAQIDNAKKLKSPLYQKVKDATGADFKAVTVGNASWESTLNNYYNTNTLPDIFVSYAMDRAANYKKWIKDGAVLPISDYVSDTQYPNINKRLKDFNYLAERLPYADGKHYAVPIKNLNTHGMFIRTDWIDNLNGKLTECLTKELGRAPTAAELTSMQYKVPETLQDFYRVAWAFSHCNPRNDGKQTYGYISSESNMWFNNWIFQAYGSTFFGMVPDGAGGLTASWTTEGNKKAVAFLNKMYNEDILDPDYIATTSADKITKFVSGQVGIMVENIWYNTILDKIKSAAGVSDETAKTMFKVIPPPKGEDGSYGMRGDAGFWCATSLNGRLGESERNKALKLLDYLLSDEGEELFTYGVEGEHYKVENGEKVSLMGTDKSGRNYTLEQKDPMFALGTLVDWSKSYTAPFQSNGEEIAALIAAAQEYKRVDPVLYVQTPLYIDSEQTLGSNSVTEFVSLIAKNYGGYSSKNGPISADWAGLSRFSGDYGGDWNSFVNKYNTTWGGKSMIDEYSAAAKKYL